MLHEDLTLVRGALTDNEAMDGHARNGDHTRVRRKREVDRGRVSWMIGYDPALPGVRPVTAHCRCDPGVLVTNDVDGSIIVEETDDAAAVTRAHGAGRFVLLFKAFVADVGGIARWTDYGYVRFRIAGVDLRHRGFGSQ